MVAAPLRPRGLAASAFALLLSLSFAGWAAPPAGPLSGSGTRKAPAASPPSGPPPVQAGTAEPVKKSHKTGRPPKTPNPVLPEGAARQPEDTAARAAVAGGRTSAGRLEDPELVALRDADRILFPRTLSGFRSGWSWDGLDPSAQEQGLPPIVQALPSATSEDAQLSEWLRSLSLPDFPVRFDARVVQYLKFYRDNKSGRAIAEAWVKKVGRYGPAMQAELSRMGLPKDLVWLSVIESGHDPTAQSPAGAAGMWQFIPESGRMYGLTVDRWVDERLDPARSTQAAGAYLGDLYQRFGSWELAMGAYNMGHGGMLRSVRKYNSNDFWQLSRHEAALPWETSLYVPKVFALAIVMNNKRAFGLDGIPADPAISFDTVYVAPGVSLDDVAAASGIPVESLRAMNPQYLSGRIPPTDDEAAKNTWPVRVPVGRGAKAATALARGKHGGQFRTTVVRHGDTVASVAARWHTTDKALATLNGFGANETLQPGTVVLVPATQDKPRDVESLIAVVPQARPVPAGKKRVYYQVLPGDTPESIAHALGVSALELLSWNALDPAAKLQSEMTLQAFVPRDANLSHVRVATDASTEVLIAGTVPFIDHFEAQNGRKRLVVSAKAGETLAGIGQRYGLSVGMMERINRVSRSHKLNDGDPVVVYVKSGQGGGDDTSGKPLAQIEAPRPDVLPRVE